MRGWVIAASVVGGAVFLVWLGRRAQASTVQEEAISVYDEDGRPTWLLAKWQSTPEQSAKFGPRFPNFYTLDEGGLFMFERPGVDISRAFDASGKLTSAAREMFDFYKPTWPVKVGSTV